VIKWRRMRWAGHAARMGKERGVYRVSVGKLVGKIALPFFNDLYVKFSIRSLGIFSAAFDYLYTIQLQSILYEIITVDYVTKQGE